MKEKPLVQKTCLLEKYPGKAGWTFARVPEIAADRQAPFGWVKVKGSIDGYPIRQYHLMPMGDGHLFLPVKAEIRKKIRKQAGDTVDIILFPDNDPLILPEEFLDCLRDEPEAYKNFQAFTESEKKQFLDWIHAARKEETRTQRMAEAIDAIRKGEKRKKDNQRG